MPKVKIEKTQYYTIISNIVLNDIRLSWRAKGLWAYMMSLPDDWDYSIRGLATRAKDGRDSVISGLNELKKYGYLTVETVRDSCGRIVDSEYTIYEESIHKQVAENPDTVKPDTEYPPEKGRKVAENPDTVKPDTVNPDPVNLSQQNKQRTKYIYNKEKQGNKKIYIAPPAPVQEQEKGNPDPVDPKRERGPVDPNNPPSVESIAAYCRRLQDAGVEITVDPEAYADYYDSRGWEKIRDWKATLRIWLRNQQMNRKKNAATASQTDFSPQGNGIGYERDSEARIEPLKALYAQYTSEERRDMNEQLDQSRYVDGTGTPKYGL
ncbi:helix-turn-helix domain-containing protein [uncultured Megasphaera sp.]|uniref:helix-turn-helix domain-containing protein n=1 Tax=uncultured Megasphaera sp. TaxID=165188 RepID=UPI00266CEC22|nr:helix-turn-helix domain-containing protein [uncultured Megasphaera sp.]